MHTPISDCERQSGASLRVVEEAVLSAVRMRCGCIDTPPQQAAGHWDTLLPAPVLVLFSGGVDSTLLAAAVHRYLPQGQPVDLSNVCFDGGRSPDRRAAISALQELRECVTCVCGCFGGGGQVERVLSFVFENKGIPVQQAHITQHGHVPNGDAAAVC
jgi:hypothetical protein